MAQLHDDPTTELTGPGGAARIPRAALLLGIVLLAAGLAACALAGLPAEEQSGGEVVVFTGGLVTAGLGALVLLAAAVRRPWRVPEMVVAAVLGVAGGLLFVVWNPLYAPIDKALAFYPPLSGLVAGVWLLPAVLGGLVIRKPGAAIYVEVVAALVETLAGSPWGLSNLWYGLAQGLGAELVLLLFWYRRTGLPTAMLAGAASGVVSGFLTAVVYGAGLSADYRAAIIALTAVSGAVIAGIGGWALTRALAAAGALAPLASAGAGERV